MKTETQEQLEKEIREIQKKIIEDKFSESDTLNLFEVEAKLFQHKTDIKNFEKLIDDLKYNSNDLLEYKKRIKEALKEL